MAIDKAIDSAVLDANLTTVADAIRAKGGTTDALSFPTGFSDAISAIQAGGGGDESVFNSLIDRSITEVSSNATSIGSYAFYGCTNLTTINFPKATSMDQYSFQGCTNLTAVNMPVTTTSGLGGFYGCTGLTTVKLPVATTLGTNSFRGCKKLTTADFPLVTNIGTYAFQDCTNITALIIRSNTVCSLSSNALKNTPIESSTGYIYVPATLVDRYKTNASWSKYANQFRALEDYTVDGTIDGELDETKI